MDLLHLHQLSFSYGEHAVVRDASLTMQPGEVLVVVGPSGCGKTSLLRMIAGLERPSQGTIDLNGQRLSGPDAFVLPEARAVGMVFQGLALFPHLTVEGNVGFGLSQLSKAERKARVNEELVSVGLVGLGDRFPDQLSGGQQQRVAIARSLVRRPALMLMDEPFSDLDHHTRTQVRTEVLRILRDHGTAAIIVTHDREDAFHLGDRIVLMEEGRIVRVAPAGELRAEWSKAPFST